LSVRYEADGSLEDIDNIGDLHLPVSDRAPVRALRGNEVGGEPLSVRQRDEAERSAKGEEGIGDGDGPIVVEVARERRTHREREVIPVNGGIDHIAVNTGNGEDIRTGIERKRRVLDRDVQEIVARRGTIRNC
jgi:hypothetical protein